ncbi:MAG: AsmA family protein [Burkholderiaceae bacterium]
MGRAARIGLWIVGIIVGVAVVLAVTVSVFDWNRLKPWINHRVSESIGREFAIRGDLSVHWRHAGEATTGWRRLVPWPQIEANDIVLANADWTGAKDNMVHVGKVAVSLNPLPLLAKTVSMPYLEVDAPQVLLQRDDQGRNNWTFKNSDNQPSSWNFQLNQIALRDASLHFIDTSLKLDLRATADTLDQPGRYGLSWKLSGTFDKLPISGGGKAGAILSLQDRKTPYPVQASAKAGETAIEAEGTLTDPAHLSGLDLKLKISGASLAQLYPITGIVLPETPLFSTAGHLIGALKPGGGDWRYEDFTGSIGDSDLSGTLAYLTKKPRPLLQGKVQSKVLRIDDLAALVGSDPKKARVARGDKTPQPPNKVLPVEKFRTDRWHDLDIDVAFEGKKIVSKKVPADTLSTKIKLQDSVLTLSPLHVGMADGTLDGDIRLDGKEEPLKGKMTVSARHLQLKRLFPAMQTGKARVGQLNGDLSLTSTGNSPAALLGNADGNITMLVNQGTISRLLLEEIGLNLGSVVVTKLFGDKAVQLDCMAGDIPVHDGVLTMQTFVVDTDAALLTMTGTVNMAKETLDLTIHPKTKGFRLLSLRSPIHIRGTFKNPDVGIDTGLVALKAGAAAVLGTIAAPLAALVPLINPGDQKDVQCGQLLKSVRK